MQVLVERGCGLDVHQATVVACFLVVGRDGRAHKQIRTFGTTTRELGSLREWLLAQGCTHVGMESTGVYWKPVYAILEGAFEIVIANAQHVKKVPGRKTDVKDAEWIAELLCHGLLRPSFVPPQRTMTPATTLDELGLSSLDRVELLVDLEQQFDTSLDELLLPGAQTVSALAGISAPPRRAEIPTWSRRWPARVIRNVALNALWLPLMRTFAHAQVAGLECLASLQAPLIFVSNHQTTRIRL
jgi:acyl carrier protein